MTLTPLTTITSLTTRILPFLLLCATFFSCRDGGRAKGILRTADSLMEEHPESALAILKSDSLEICSSGKDFRLWYALSRTEADDKCYILHVSDSAIRIAAGCYDSYGSALQRVRADYFLGRVYCDMHLYGHALTSFNKAIAVDAENDSVINRYKARAATWAGYVYEAKGLHKDALRYNKLAYGYAKQAGAQVTEVYSLRDIGRSYSYLKQNNTAIPYYRQAAKKAKAIGDANLYNMVMEELAGIYIEEGRLDEAYAALNTKFLATTDKDIASHYYIWAMYFEKIGQLDSSVAYDKRGMIYSEISIKRDVSLDLARLLTKQGKRDEAMEYYEKYSIRRYGFHGTSHRYVSARAAEFLGLPIEKLKMVTCHIGNGASIAAVDGGKSVDTSMGLTPTEGLMMGTRCGDVDAGALIFLMKRHNLSADDLMRIVNKESGVLGISGLSNDMREIEAAVEAGDERATLALAMDELRIVKYIGAYAAEMGGLDVIVFTGGVGENQTGLREDVCRPLAFMGVEIDKSVNDTLRGREALISTKDSRVKVVVIPTDEELMIARDTAEIVSAL